MAKEKNVKSPTILELLKAIETEALGKFDDADEGAFFMASALWGGKVIGPEQPEGDHPACTSEARKVGTGCGAEGSLDRARGEAP